MIFVLILLAGYAGFLVGRMRRWVSDLEGDQKTLFPPKDASESLSQAYWAGATSDYLNTSVVER